MTTLHLMLLALFAVLIVPMQHIGAEEASSLDKQFAAKVASNNMLEIRLGQYASGTGESKDVKCFAEHMVNDHQKARDLLEKIASEKGMELPRHLNEEDEKTLDRLETLSGADFDRAYVSQMVADHEAAVKAAEDESRDGTQVEMKYVAEKLLPTLQSHLTMAKALAADQPGNNAKASAGK